MWGWIQNYIHFYDLFEFVPLDLMICNSAKRLTKTMSLQNESSTLAVVVKADEGLDM